MKVTFSQEIYKYISHLTKYICHVTSLLLTHKSAMKSLYPN